MKMYPIKSKFAKYNKGRTLLRVNSNNIFKNQHTGSIGLKLMASYKLTSKHLSTIHFLLNKLLKKSGRLIMKVFPQSPITKKPNEIRMGKGKGAVAYWACRVLAGTVICEIETNSLNIKSRVLKLVKYRLPVKVKIITF